MRKLTVRKVLGWAWWLVFVAIVFALVLWAQEEVQGLVFVSPLVSPLVSPVQPTPLPVMPKKPKGLDACPLGAIEVYTDIGYPTCNTWVVMENDLDVKPMYITGCVLKWGRLGDLCKLDPEPPPNPRKVVPPTVVAPTPVPDDEVLMDVLWMGACQMWWSPAEGRVTKVVCP